MGEGLPELFQMFEELLRRISPFVGLAAQEGCCVESEAADAEFQPEDAGCSQRGNVRQAADQAREISEAVVFAVLLGLDVDFVDHRVCTNGRSSSTFYTPRDHAMQIEMPKPINSRIIAATARRWRVSHRWTLRVRLTTKRPTPAAAPVATTTGCCTFREGIYVLYPELAPDLRRARLPAPDSSEAGKPSAA